MERQDEKVRLLLTIGEWDSIRFWITIQELRLRAKLSVAQIASLLNLSEDEVRMHMREPVQTAWHVSDTLTVRAEVHPAPKQVYYKTIVALEAWRHDSIHAHVQALMSKAPPSAPPSTAP